MQSRPKFRHPEILKAARKGKIAKSRHGFALKTLAALRDHGTISAELLTERMSGRHAVHQTRAICIELMVMGCLEGTDQHPELARGIPHRYALTPLGRALLAWA